MTNLFTKKKKKDIPEFASSQPNVHFTHMVTDAKYIYLKLTNLCAHVLRMSELHLPKEGLLEPILPSEATVVMPLLFSQVSKFSSKDNKY